MLSLFCFSSTPFREGVGGGPDLICQISVVRCKKRLKYITKGYFFVSVPLQSGRSVTAYSTNVDQTSLSVARTESEINKKQGQNKRRT